MFVGARASCEFQGNLKYDGKYRVMSPCLLPFDLVHYLREPLSFLVIQSNVNFQRKLSYEKGNLVSLQMIGFYRFDWWLLVYQKRLSLNGNISRICQLVRKFGK